MPISIDWGTLVISIPQSYLVFVSGTLWEMDTDQFRLDLRALEAGVGNRSAPGMIHPKTHNHNTEVTIAGITYARLVEIINGYTITFEDGVYAVSLIGSNNNLFDEGIINRNRVSIIPSNSAGLINLASILNSFETEIYFDSVNGVAGQASSVGSSTNPSNNVADALDMVLARGKVGVRLVEGTFVLDRAMDNKVFAGSADPETSVFDFNGFSLTRSRVERCLVQGDANSQRVVLDACILDGVSNIHGLFERCYLRDHALDSGADNVTYDRSRSHVPGSAKPLADFNGRTGDVEFRGHIGGLQPINMTSALSNVSFDISAGAVTLAATCTDAASMVIRGTGLFQNNSSISLAKINSTGIQNPTLAAEATWGTDLSAYITDGTAGQKLLQLLDLIEADYDATTSTLIVKHRVTGATLLTKAITGGSVIAVGVEDPP